MIQLYQFDYKREVTLGEPLREEFLITILTGNEKSRIVYDAEGLLGLNKTFGINYGVDGKKGFIHDDIEYVINSRKREIDVSRPHRFRANLLFDADKRDQFRTYKIKFNSIDAILAVFTLEGYELIKV